MNVNNLLKEELIFLNHFWIYIYQFYRKRMKNFNLLSIVLIFNMKIHRKIYSFVRNWMRDNILF